MKKSALGIEKEPPRLAGQLSPSFRLHLPITTQRPPSMPSQGSCSQQWHGNPNNRTASSQSVVKPPLQPSKSGTLVRWGTRGLIAHWGTDGDNCDSCQHGPRQRLSMSQLQTRAHSPRCPQRLRRCMSLPEHTCECFLQPTLTLNDTKAMVWGLRSQATFATSWGGMQPQFSVSRGLWDSAQLRLQMLLGYSVSLFVKHKHSILLNLSVAPATSYILWTIKFIIAHLSLTSSWVQYWIWNSVWGFFVLWPNLESWTGSVNIL